jgi:hypothetical protein
MNFFSPLIINIHIIYHFKKNINIININIIEMNKYLINMKMYIPK